MGGAEAGEAEGLLQGSLQCPQQTYDRDAAGVGRGLKGLLWPLTWVYFLL